MKKHLLIYVSLFLTLFLPKVDAGNTKPGWYIRGFGGWNHINNLSSEDSTLEIEDGYLIGGSVGYKLTQLLRLEGEIGYRENKINTWILNNIEVPLDGEISTLTLMANAIVDCPFPGKYIRPYLGGGIGYGRNLEEIEFPDAVARYLGYSAVESVGYNITYQGMAGLSFEFFEKADFRLAYSYLNGLYMEGNHSVSLALKQYF